MAIGFYVDTTVCTECKACQIACKDLHDLKVGINLRTVHRVEGGTFPKPWVYHLSMACNHCENPACVAICPTGATQKLEDGTVWNDHELCIGCESCVNECPYGAPKLVAELGITYRCDGCKDLRAQGLNPACVDACNMRCLEFGDIEELRAKHAGENLTADLPPLPDSSQTAPNLIVGAKNVDTSSYRLFGVE